MLFSVQKNNLTYWLEFLPEMTTIKVSSQSLGFFLAQFDVSIQVSHMIDITKRDFREYHRMQIPIIQNQFVTIGMISQIPEQVTMDYP